MFTKLFDIVVKQGRSASSVSVDDRILILYRSMKLHVPSVKTSQVPGASAVARLKPMGGYLGYWGCHSQVLIEPVLEADRVITA